MKKTKRQNILEHLQRHGTINPIQAMNHYHCMRLAAVVFDLKKQGHSITTVKRETQNDASFAEYHYHTKIGTLKCGGKEIADVTSFSFSVGEEMPCVGSFQYPENITLSIGGVECGRLFMKDEKLHFEGDVDKSAEVFFDSVKHLFNTGGKL